MNGLKIRRVAALTLCVAMMLTLVGCSQPAQDKQPQQQKSVAGVIEDRAQEEASSAAQDAAPDSASAQDDASAESAQAEGAAHYDSVDVDLTKMNSNLVYSTVNQMVNDPSEFEGKVVRAQGSFNVSQMEDTGNRYYFVLVADATACCAQGLEFVWDDGTHVFPGEYPDVSSDIEVTGVFETYMEDGYEYSHLVDAELKA